MDIDFENEIQFNQRRRRVLYEKSNQYVTTRTIIARSTDEVFFSIQTKSNNTAFNDLQDLSSTCPNDSAEDENQRICPSVVIDQYLNPAAADTNVENEAETITNDVSSDLHDQSSFISVEDRSFNDYDEIPLADIQHLHDYTPITREAFCFELMKFLRDANVCKSHSNRLICLIQSILPIPNCFPSTMNDLLSLIGFSDLFVKRSVCLQCKTNLNYNQRNCSRCSQSDETNIALIYDVKLSQVLSTTLKRLSMLIQAYKNQINGSDDKGTRDIPFGNLYQSLLKKYSNENIVSLILHLDGISLTKSTRLKMWLLSGCLVEIPPVHRYNRSNMIVMSIWIGHQEPDPDVWLQHTIFELKQLKEKG